VAFVGSSVGAAESEGVRVGMAVGAAVGGDDEGAGVGLGVGPVGAKVANDGPLVGIVQQTSYVITLSKQSKVEVETLILLVVQHSKQSKLHQKANTGPATFRRRQDYDKTCHEM
jgi:hypothetical protein